MYRRKENEPVLRGLFSDTTGDYVIPPRPDLYRKVTIRLRVGAKGADACFLVTGKKHRCMRLAESDDCFDYYAVEFELTVSPLRYYFEISAGGQRIRYTRRGVRNTIRPGDFWHILPGFHLPAWAEGAVMYQIFVDRFCNGDPSNDVRTGEYIYMGKPSLQIADWEKPPSAEGYREFYGGDLQGVIDRLDYLQELGVEGIYLNPVFLSPSSHKYDTQDYEHIDPHFGRIVHEGRPRPERKTCAAPGKRTFHLKAQRFPERATDPVNLAASDRLFAKLVREAHARGIRVILDGVFNHCGSFHRWMDAERIYEKLPGGRKGARASARSPYAGYFLFKEKAWPGNDSYESWWDFGTLPKLNYENSEELCRYILQIGKKWVSPPYNADGWRLDVAADLGHSSEFNHRFWKRFRKAVKEANPDAVILAENYADSWKWLQGDEWDTIMNYEFFMEPVSAFFTGMEKHSDAREDTLYGDPDAFWRAAGCLEQDTIDDAVLRISMNQLSNHDHSRFLTRTNRVAGRAEKLGAAAATEGVHMEVMRQAVLLQMTWPGAPTIYYGDEAGLGGFTDPDNRRTYPWGREDRELLRCHRILIALRRSSAALRKGSLLRLADEDGILAYARFTRPPSGKDSPVRDGKRIRHPSAGKNAAPAAGKNSPHVYYDGTETWIVLFNINYIPVEYETDVVCAGIPPEEKLECVLYTVRGGFGGSAAEEKSAQPADPAEKSAQPALQPVAGPGTPAVPASQSADAAEKSAQPAPRPACGPGTPAAPESQRADAVEKHASAGGEAEKDGEKKKDPPLSPESQACGPALRDGLPARIPVRGGILRLTLPPESGILLRWRPSASSRI